MKAVITGIGGQDGSYLTELLLEKGYEVVGMAHRATQTMPWLQHLAGDERLRFVTGSLLDGDSIRNIVRRELPDEIYNLGGMSFVPPSFAAPALAMQLNVGGLAHILKAVQELQPHCHVYQAGTAEMFGGLRPDDLTLRVCDENSAMWPLSPYAVSKLAAHHLCRVYREHGVFVVGGIAGNHESPRRGREMVTRKVCRAVRQWRKTPGVPTLFLGNIMLVGRDWSHAKDIVRGMHLSLQHSEPRDYVFGSGKWTLLYDFIEAAFRAAGFADMAQCWKWVSAGDARFTRMVEPPPCQMAPTTAANLLGWKCDYSFDELVREMVTTEERQ
ncbi:MAG: GDP-mannose 4,6-dehydratase [Patescibacteria group bacterium]|nr:GDP-mannose 4,6-dehydratase [Patescibacteria group bacterium]